MKMNMNHICIIAMAVVMITINVSSPSYAMADPADDDVVLKNMFDEFMSESTDDIDEEEVEEELLSFVASSKNATSESDVSAQGWRSSSYAQNFVMPTKYKNIRQYCSHLTRIKDVTLTQMYEDALPLTGKMPHGCVPGCLIGNSLASAQQRGPQGADNAEWIGKVSHFFFYHTKTSEIFVIGL